MATTYERLEQKPYDSHYLYAETTIDYPVVKVWPHALNIGSWMRAHRLETLAGEPGTVGHFERVLRRDIGTNVPPPHYHLYGIAEIIPQKLIVLEVFPEKDGSYGDARERMSFDAILFTDLDRQTRMVFLMTDVHMGKGDEGFHERQRMALEAGRESMDRNFENLRALVEAAG